MMVEVLIGYGAGSAYGSPYKMCLSVCVCVFVSEPSSYAAGADTEVGRGRDEGTQDRPEGRILFFMSHQISVSSTCM